MDNFTDIAYQLDSYLEEFSRENLEKVAAELSLAPFNQEYCDSLDKRERRLLLLPPQAEAKWFRTVKLGNKRVGIVGAPYQTGRYWAQIIIDPDYRGKRYAGKAEELLANELSIKKMHAMIAKWNSASIKAHLRLGYKPVAPRELTAHYEYGLLPKYMLLYEKEF